ncbi:alpha/beta hydrolase [Asaia krungthepensis]|uniref:Xylanase n=1 Tax=Asaia krungthepensis NRIC 0535 TaxID=1307925 RepID=A0ABQ0Q1T0_9PROT|nr:alpha/beta hydrolase [Asaia krungthepensis]GBQ87286.1 xylanase [Asaia krungthepensis NRIC 0535]
MSGSSARVSPTQPLVLPRRSLLASTLGFSAATLTGCHGPSHPKAPEQIALWSDAPPGGGGPRGPEQATAKGALYNITEPRLEIFRPERPNGSAVLIAAGGGYQRIGMQREAYPAAHWLTARGVTAYVLVYRLPSEGWAEGPLAPLQDARRALSLIGRHARADGIDPARITLLGFSAGGHLMGMTASQWHGSGPFVAFEHASRAPRPAGAALIYPVITLEKPYDHTATHRDLVGMDAEPALARLWSVQSHVMPGYPPVFLTQADNDRIANPYNASLMARTCTAIGTAVDYRRLPSGGHGFGMGEPDQVTSRWPQWYEAWLQQYGMI